MKVTVRLLIAIFLVASVGSAGASIVYSWQAACLYRFTLNPPEPLRDLGCPSLVVGAIEMPDNYVPGTTFQGFNLPVDHSPVFTMFSDFERLNLSTPMFEFVTIQLPVFSGLGNIFWNANAIGLRNLQFRIESPFPGGSGIDLGPMVFTRIPEPKSILLVALAIAALAVSRRSVRRARLEAPRPAYLTNAAKNE